MPKTIDPAARAARLSAVTKPPERIDGAKVLQVATLEDSTATGRTRHVVAGRDVTTFATLVLAQYDHDSGINLFYCDENWNPVTDTYHDDLEHAVAQAEFEFDPVAFTPVPA